MDGGINFICRGPPAPTLPAILVFRSIQQLPLRDRPEPASERHRIDQFADLLPRREKRFLRQILRSMGLAGLEIQSSENPSSRPMHEGFEGRAIAASAACRQLLLNKVLAAVGQSLLRSEE
jgi:hypothetical protein